MVPNLIKNLEFIQELEMIHDSEATRLAQVG